MKSFLLAALLMSLLLLACGGQDSTDGSSPLSVVPERAMVSIVLNDPAGMVSNIDGYIRDGAPLLGENLLENLICNQLDVSSLDSITSRYGFNPSGEVAFWMESALPQSIGMAASAPDFPLFISLLEEMGMELTNEDPILGQAVFSIDSEDGTMYIAGVRGVALMAMSPTRLESLISTLSSETSYEVEPTSLTMKFNLSMIGPMAVAQMPMARMLMMQGMAADTTMPAFVPAMMDVYMDGIEVFLSQADELEISLVTAPEDFIVSKNISFIAGSSLAEMLVANDDEDMLEYITQGDLATVRFQMPSEIAYNITRAFTEVFTSEIDDEVLHFWSSMASNGAVSIYNDGFMHMVAAYALPENISIEDIAVMYSEYLDVIMPFIGHNEEIANSFSFIDNGIVQIDGSDFYSMSMSIQDSTMSMNFDYWLTVHNGVLLLETASQPSILLSIVSGDYIPAELEGTGEIAGEMSLAGYFNMIMALSQSGMDIPEIGSDVIFNWNSSFDQGGIHGEMTMDGSDALSTGFTIFGIISAME